MFGGYPQLSRFGLGAVASRGINWSSILTNTSKTLGVINQAIPAFYQIKPVVNNMKTMFRVAKEINGSGNNKSKNNLNQKNNSYNTIQKETNTTSSINFFA